MINKNDEIIVTIDDYGNNLEGIAHVNTQTIFIKDACVGEKLLIKIIFSKKNLCFGKILKIIEKSTVRVEPKCPYYYRCGGCNCQHINYENTLKIKADALNNTIKKIANIDTKILNTIKSKNEYFYRNKTSLPVRKINGRTILGLFKENSHDIVEIESCCIQSNNINKLIPIIKDYIFKYSIEGYDEINAEGTLRHIVAREIDGSILVTLVINTPNIEGLEYLDKKLFENFDKYGLNINYNFDNNNVILGKKSKHISGLKEINVQEYGIDYSVNQMSFLQVNDDIKHKIYVKVLEFIDINSVVIDAYSGAGLLTSILSKKCKKAIGIEIVEEAVKNANELIAKNNIHNMENYLGDTSEILPKIAQNIKEDLIIVLDPPRTGCDKKVIDQLNEILPKKIVYISCSPQTLSRDLSYLKDNYEINFIQPYDMFPMTKHVETLVVLNKK